MSLDVLAFGPHPDDVELFCGGTVAKLTQAGYKVGIIDMTRGEMGTRGSREERDAEAAEAAKILNLTLRENLDLPDGFLNQSDRDQRHVVVEAIRRHTPKLVIAPTARDRHPDHQHGARLVEDAVFLANAGKYPSDLERHKVLALMFYPMWWHPEADLIVDVSETWETRTQAARAFVTQFGDRAEGNAPATFLASKNFLEWVEGRGTHFGAIIGVSRGEPFLLRNPVPVDDPFKLLVDGAGVANP